MGAKEDAEAKVKQHLMAVRREEIEEHLQHLAPLVSSYLDQTPGDLHGVSFALLILSARIAETIEPHKKKDFTDLAHWSWDLAQAEARIVAEQQPKEEK